MNTNQPLNNAEFPELDPELENAVWAVLSEPIDSDAVDRVKERAVGLGSDVPPVHLPNAPSLSFSRLVKALAACLVFAMAVFFFVVSSSDSAFAQVLQNLRNAETLTFTRLIYTDDSDRPIRSRVMIAKDGRQRTEVADTVTIMDASNRIRLTLITSAKRALVPGGRSGKGTKSGFVAWLDRLRSDADPDHEEIGTRSIDGRKVQGSVVKQGQIDYRVWIDVLTGDLIEIENEFPVKGSKIQRVVMTDFQFANTLDESLFSTEVPTGFQITETPTFPETTKLSGEERIREGLRGFAKLNDGRFPDSIVDSGEWAIAFSSDGKLSEDETKVLGYLGGSLPFLMSMEKADYDYLGKGNRAGEGERRIVFWYRQKSGLLRAIFSDLSVSEIEEADLPE